MSADLETALSENASDSNRFEDHRPPSSFLVRLGQTLIPQHDLQVAYKYIFGRYRDGLTITQWFLAIAFRVLRKIGKLEKIRDSYMKDWVSKNPTYFDQDILNLQSYRIYDPPEIKVHPNRPKTINVLVPAFQIETISAGFFGVFQLALFMARSGRNVRLVMYENFDFSIDRFRSSLKNFPGLENLLDELEVDYIGERKSPLLVSSEDICVATVWYSAYVAEAVRQKLGAAYFLYLIQDYEPAFHSSGTHFTAAHQSYSLPHKAIFSTEALQNYFIAQNLAQGTAGVDYTFFNNACSSSPPKEKEFLKIKSGRTRRLAFYSRPTVDRNMFTLGASALVEAYRRKIFHLDKNNWEFYGMGIGNVEIYFDDESKLRQLPRMTLKQYQERMTDFDLCLTLMASPHPSIVPFDLAGSGAIVVTNTYLNKTQEYFSSISDNIIACAPEREALITGLTQAIRRTNDLPGRLAASQIQYPKQWTETWQSQHYAWLDRWTGAAQNGTVYLPDPNSEAA